MELLTAMTGRCAETAEAMAPAFLGGPYLDKAALITAFVLFTGWLMLCDWMARDVPYVGADRNLWYGIGMGVGLLGLLAMLILPPSAALLLWGLLISGLLGVYGFYRNTQVPKHLRVFTPEWFRGLLAGKIGRVSVPVQDRGPVDLRWMDGPSQLHDPPTDPDFRSGHDVASIMLFDAINRRATELTVMPLGDKFHIAFTIDGFKTEEKPIEKAEAVNLVFWVKKVAGLDLAEHRKPQKGKVGVLAAKRKVDVQLETRGSVAGEELHAKIMDKASLRKVVDLGLTAELMEQYRRIIELDRGLLVVGGLSGSGVSTTLYAMLREADLFQVNAATVEDPILMDMDNVTQNEFKGDGKGTFAKTVQTLVRAKDPDVLMIGKSDPETLQIAAVGAERKKYYIGMECASALEGLGKVIKAVGDGELVTRTLIGLSCQKLVRVLCSECKVAYKPSPDALRRLNVAPDKVSELYRPPTSQETPGERAICPKCQGTGYFGQTGAFELLVISEPIRKLILSGSPLKDIQNEARKEKMLYLHEQILRKVIEGVTSVQELMRVMGTGSTK